MDKKISKILFPTILILICTLIIAIIPTEHEAAIYRDTVRLHILPNSDEAEDQQLKLRIRDKLLYKYGTELAASSTKEEAEARIDRLLPKIEKDIGNWLHEASVSYGATVNLENEWFDTRYYEQFTLPAGYYSSLTIRLGEAEGGNWWCVMFPPMCLSIATDSSYTEPEMELIRRGDTSYRFKILEILAREFKD